MVHLRAVGALMLATGIWGGVYVVSRVVLQDIPPVPLVELRLLLSLVVLGPIFARAKVRASGGDWLLAALSGTVGFALSLVAQFYGTFWSSAHVGALVTTSAPAFIALLALPVLGERPTWRQILAIALAIGGALLVMAPGQGGGSPRGVAMLVLAAVTWAVYTVLNRRLGRRQGLAFVSFATTLFGALCLLPLSGGLLAVHWSELGWGIYLGIAYIGFVSTALAMYLWNYGFTKLPAATAGLFFFMQPLVGTVLGVWALGERLSLAIVPGAALIAGGVLLALFGGAPADSVDEGSSA